MCPACCRGTRPLALMGSVDRTLIMASGSRCPLTAGRFCSICRLTDIAITRVHPRKLVSPVSLGRIAAASPPQPAGGSDWTCGFLVRLAGLFLRPGRLSPSRRAQSRSGMATGHRWRRRAASLTVTSTAAGWGRLRSPSSCRGRHGAGPIRLLPRHHRPGDARHFVGQCHGSELLRLARPAASAVTHHSGHSFRSAPRSRRSPAGAANIRCRVC